MMEDERSSRSVNEDDIKSIEEQFGIKLQKKAVLYKQCFLVFRDGKYLGKTISPRWYFTNKELIERVIKIIESNSHD